MELLYETIEKITKTEQLAGLAFLDETSNLTYLELRQLFTQISRVTRNKEAKEMLRHLLIALEKLESRKIPAPVIRKIKSISPTIFNANKLPNWE